VVMDPLKRPLVVMTRNLRDRPSKPTPNPKEEDSHEIDIFQRIRFGLVDNGIFKIECPVGLGVVKKILGRQLHWAYKKWKKKMDSKIRSFPVYNIAMLGSLGEEEKEEKEVPKAMRSIQGQKERC
jgi:hypothetical protein